MSRSAAGTDTMHHNGQDPVDDEIAKPARTVARPWRTWSSAEHEFVANRLCRIAELLTGAAHNLTMASSAFRFADVEAYEPLGEADLPHAPRTGQVDSYTTALRAIAGGRKLVAGFEAQWDNDLMDGLLDDVQQRQSLDQKAMIDAIEEEIFGPWPGDDLSYVGDSDDEE